MFEILLRLVDYLDQTLKFRFEILSDLMIPLIHAKRKSKIQSEMQKRLLIKDPVYVNTFYLVIDETREDLLKNMASEY